MTIDLAADPRPSDLGPKSYDEEAEADELAEIDKRFVWFDIVDQNGDPVVGAVVNYTMRYDGTQDIFEQVPILQRYRTTTTESDNGPPSQGYNNYTYPFNRGGNRATRWDINYADNQARQTTTSKELIGETFGPIRVVVHHAGKKIYDGRLHQSDFGTGINGRLQAQIVVDETNYPGGFSGATGAAQIGRKLAVTWDPQREGSTRGYEVSVGENERLLFRGSTQDTNTEGHPRTQYIDQAGSTRAVTLQVNSQETGHALLSWRPFMENAVVGVRKIGETWTGALVEPAVESEGGSDVPTGIELSPSGRPVLQGNSFILEATAIGPGAPNKVVEFAGYNGEVLHSGINNALVVADQTATFEAASILDATVKTDGYYPAETYDEWVEGPTTPSNLKAVPYGENNSMRVTWDPPGPSNTTALWVSGRYIKHYETQDNVAVIKNVSRPTTVYIHHRGPQGTTSSIESVRVDPEQTSARPAALLKHAVPTVQMGPGGMTSLDLSPHVHIYEPQTGEGEKAPEPLNFRVEKLGPDDLTVTNNGLTLSFTLDSETEATSEDINVILVHIERSPRQHLTVPVVVTRGAETAVQAAKSVAGIPVRWLAAVDPDIESLVGANFENLGLRAQGSAFSRALHTISVIEDEESGAITEVKGYDSEDGQSSMALFKGSKGVGAFMATSHAGAAHAIPLLPQGNITEVERRDGFIEFNEALYKVEAAPDQWRRVVTNGSQLWDIKLGAPPKEVYTEPPIYYGNSWLNQSQYPADAQIDWELGVVRYRGGFETERADPANLSVDRLEAIPQEEGFEVQWDVLVDKYPVDGIVDVTVTPEAAQQGVTPQSFTLQGDGRAELTSLDANLSYTFEIANTTVTETPLQPLPELTVRAKRTPDLNYAYTYETDATPDLFIDTFGTEHTSPTFPLKVTSKDIALEHGVQFVWNDSEEEKDLRVAADWQVPSETVTETFNTRVGRALKAQDIPVPTFEVSRYKGTTEKRIAINVFSAGRHRIEPVGYLPVHMDGELEDHVDVYFMAMDGTDLGPEIELDQPTELEVHATVQAEEGQSPVFILARVATWK